MKNDRLRDLIKNMDRRISYDEYRLRYAAERFLMRMQQSPYQGHLILKGGFLLGAIYQVEKRTTKDLDTLIKDLQADRASIQQLLTTIIAINLEDGVYFELEELQDSQKNRIYQGYRAKLRMYMDGRTNITFDLDIGVGDVITPGPQLRTIPLIFNENKGEEKSLTIYSYPLETVLAEKTEIILTLGVQNSRMKDFYDIHLILNDPELPDINSLYEAFIKTWTFRQGEIDEEMFADWAYTVNTLANDHKLKDQTWQKYIATRPYAKDVDWQKTIQQFDAYINELKKVYLRRKEIDDSLTGIVQGYENATDEKIHQLKIQRLLKKHDIND